MFVVGEQIGEAGKRALPWPGCGLYAGVSGVRGGEGERLPGRCRRIDGRNLRSRSRRGGVSIEPLPMAELAGEISGVGDPVAGASRDSLNREHRAR